MRQIKLSPKLRENIAKRLSAHLNNSVAATNLYLGQVDDLMFAIRMLNVADRKLLAEAITVDFSKPARAALTPAPSGADEGVG